MTTKTALELAGCQLAEGAVFGLALVALVWSGRDLPSSFPIWCGLLIAGVVYLVLGGVPFPRGRRSSCIGIAGFVAPLVIVGYISWNVEYFLLFEHVGAWSNLPRVLLEPENVGAAAALSICALLGRWISTRLFASKRPGIAQER